MYAFCERTSERARCPGPLLGLMALFAGALLVVAPRASRAQAELVVRLEDGPSTGALAQSLRQSSGVQAPSAVAGADADLTALMQHVTQARPVFRAGRGAAGEAAPGAQGPRQPIPAFTLQFPDSTALRQAQDRLSGRADVAYAARTRTYSIQRGSIPAGSIPASEVPLPPRSPAPSNANDPFLDSLRYFSAVRVPEAHEVTTGDEDVRVGVVDTGLFFEHPDLEGQVWVNPDEDLNGNGRVDESDFNGEDDDGNGFVDDLRGWDFVDRPGVLYTGDYADPDPDPSHDRANPASVLGNSHGTNVAGIVAAAKSNGEGIAGTAPGVQLVPLRAFGGDGDGTDDDIAAAIVYAADLGVDVLNFSFGDVVYSRIMEEAVEYAAARGVVMAASAGNNSSAGGLQDEHYPSDFPEVISTAQLALEVDLEGGLVLSIPGRYGTGLDLSAPGTGIFTTTLPRALTGPEPDAPAPAAFYKRASGSSFAAPQVAATAALLRSLKPDLAAASIRSIVTASAEDLESEGWDQRTGAGLLDVAGAVRRALPARSAITRPETNGGIRADEFAVTGSAVAPSFRSFSVSYARGDSVGLGEDDLDFTRIAGPTRRQVLRDTLAVWDTGALAEGLYTLRLATRLQDGSTVEERRRVYIDRSAPEVQVRLLDAGLVKGEIGVMADVETDDRSTVTMRVRGGGLSETVQSDWRARRHGLSCSAPGAGGGAAEIEIRVTNEAGLTATVKRTVQLPPNRLNPALFEEDKLRAPAGLLMPTATDYDRDGLGELTLKEKDRRGAFTDTVRVYEWAGDGGFRAAGTLLTNTVPRDAGETNDNGLREMLFQESGLSILFEQSNPSAAPFSRVIYADTTATDADSTRINGALLTNLDARFDGPDEHGEVLGYDGATWYVNEARADGTYPLVARFGNPTTDSTDAELPARVENQFSASRVVSGDFDGDGRGGVVAMDAGGDVVLYEAQGDDRYEAVWTHRSRRYAGAGRRIAAGDFDGDGTDEFATYTRPFVGTNSDVERGPLFARYSLWDQASGSNTYRRAARLSIKDVDPRGAGTLADGAMTAADVDGDGRAELAVVDAPALYVFRVEEGRLVPVFHREVTDPPTEASPRTDGLETQALVAEDFDGDGAPELVSSAGDGRLRRFVYQRAAGAAPPPRWVQAAAPGEARVRLAWRAAGTDSVVVYRGAPGSDLDRYAVVAAGDSSLADTTTVPRRYALRAHYGARGSSPLSEGRTVRPQVPPAVAEVTYPTPQIARLRFTRRLSRDVRPEQFAFSRASAGEGKQVPAGLSFAEGGRVLALRFEEVAGARGTLHWQALETADGLAVGGAPLALAFPERERGSLIVEDWDVLDAQRVALTFSAPLVPASARDASNYTVEGTAGAPTGAVAGVSYTSEAPRRVVVTVEDLRIGPTGRENVLTVEAMRGRNGQTLAAEGRTIRLSEAAADLDDVYVYPNPYHAGRHSGERVTVAGLPAEASVSVLSVQGTLVRELDERGSDGGLDWDLTDRNGKAVPAGVYLIRVNAPESNPVLKKAAVIR
ncbi:MAG: hypothetical protein BRD47_02145 [Bacteroidetes bacterium QS_8_68_28]|nr:MAG: hypothetical protein BRD47_02145 [Bacteroidetes bacterium QS_8_68_28]